MAVHFINPDKTSSIVDVLNSDPEFKIAARYMTKDVCVEVGKTKCIIKFRDGVITQIKSENAFADPWDLPSEGPWTLGKNSCNRFPRVSMMGYSAE